MYMIHSLRESIFIYTNANNMRKIDKIRQKIKDKLQERTQYQQEKYMQHYNLWNKYYGNKIWENLRTLKLSQQPYCECCYKYINRVVPATCVHHCVPFATGITEDDKWQLFTDYSNLMSLCDDCHKEVHRQMQHKHKLIDLRYYNIYASGDAKPEEV